MDVCERVRRVATLCCHCVRNIAYYKAGWDGQDLIIDEDFWRNANSNFLDVSVLEWCKLFADRKGKHHWRKVITCKEVPTERFLIALCMSKEEFDCFVDEVRTYRDKFLAHLDDERNMKPPHLDPMRNSTGLVYSTLAKNYTDYLYDAPRDIDEFFNQRFEHARSFYSFLSKC